MSIEIEDQELLEGFLTETTELLEKLDDDLVMLEKTPSDADLLNRIFRSIHTVKGASSFLGFELLVKVTHKTEDVLNRLRKGELVVTPEIMDVILEAVDLVKLLVGDIKGGDIKEREIEGTLVKLLPLLSENAGEATVIPAAAPPAAAPPGKKTAAKTKKSPAKPKKTEASAAVVQNAPPAISTDTPPPCLPP